MTEQQTHTPGPWRAFIKNGVIAVVVGAKRSHKGAKEVVKWTGFEGSDFPQHAIANSFLIAAAPDMLAALKGILDPGDANDSSLRPEWKAVVAAIAKAEGRAKGASVEAKP